MTVTCRLVMWSDQSHLRFREHNYNLYQRPHICTDAHARCTFSMMLVLQHQNIKKNFFFIKDGWRKSIKLEGVWRKSIKFQRILNSKSLARESRALSAIRLQS